MAAFDIEYFLLILDELQCRLLGRLLALFILCFFRHERMQCNRYFLEHRKGLTKKNLCNLHLFPVLRSKD